MLVYMCTLSWEYCFFNWKCFCEVMGSMCVVEIVCFMLLVHTILRFFVLILCCKTHLRALCWRPIVRHPRLSNYGRVRSKTSVFWLNPCGIPMEHRVGGKHSPSSGRLRPGQGQHRPHQILGQDVAPANPCSLGVPGLAPLPTRDQVPTCLGWGPFWVPPTTAWTIFKRSNSGMEF